MLRPRRLCVDRVVMAGDDRGAGQRGAPLVDQPLEREWRKVDGLVQGLDAGAYDHLFRDAGFFWPLRALTNASLATPEAKGSGLFRRLPLPRQPLRLGDLVGRW